MSKKIITVFGATGNQGGSVVSFWSTHPELKSKYSIRAVTRDTTKPSAQALASLGAEVVAADLNDSASLRHAVANSHAIFAVTNYWETSSKAKELAQGQSLADASFAAKVKHLIWSSLPHTTKLTHGKLPQIDHFVSKAEVQEYIEAHKSASATIATYYMPGFFMSNFLGGAGFLNPGPDGTPTYAACYSAQTLHPLIDVKVDTGAYVWGAIEAGAAADGIAIQAVSDWKTSQEIADVLSAKGGIGQVRFQQVPRDVFKSFLLPKMGDYIAEEMTQNMDLIADYSYYGVGTEKRQAEADGLLYKGWKKTGWEAFVVKNSPWVMGGK